MRPPNAFIMINGKRAQGKGVEGLGATGWGGQGGLPGGGETMAEVCKHLMLMVGSFIIYLEYF